MQAGCRNWIENVVGGFGSRVVAAFGLDCYREWIKLLSLDTNYPTKMRHFVGGLDVKRNKQYQPAHVYGS